MADTSTPAPVVATPAAPTPAPVPAPAPVAAPIVAAKITPVHGPAREYVVLEPIDYEVEGKEVHAAPGTSVSNLPVAVVGGLLLTHAIAWPPEELAADVAKREAIIAEVKARMEATEHTTSTEPPKVVS